MDAVLEELDEEVKDTIISHLNRNESIRKVIRKAGISDTMLDNWIMSEEFNSRVRSLGPESQLAEQLLIAEFHNLHLESGPEYDRGTFPLAQSPYIPPYEELEIRGVEAKKLYPKEAERERITGFLEKYAPGLQDGFGLEWYQRSKEISWFESKHFLRFADDYHRTKQFVEEFLKGKMSWYSYQWLDTKFKRYKLGITLTPHDGDEAIRVFPHLHMTTRQKYWETKEYTPDYTWIIIDELSGGMAYYGIRHLGFFDWIFRGLLEMVRQKWRIGRCQYADCRNIFFDIGGGYARRFCSNSHKTQAYLMRRRKEKASPE